MQSARPKRRTVHRDRYGSRTLAPVLRTNGLDLFDRSSARDNDIERRMAEAVEYEASRERQVYMAFRRRQVAFKAAKAVA